MRHAPRRPAFCFVIERQRKLRLEQIVELIEFFGIDYLRFEADR